jgi:hypothetical protein
VRRSKIYFGFQNVFARVGFTLDLGCFGLDVSQPGPRHNLRPAGRALFPINLTQGSRPPNFRQWVFRLGLRLPPERRAAAGLGSGLHRATGQGCGPGCGPRGELAAGWAAGLGPPLFLWRHDSRAEFYPCVTVKLLFSLVLPPSLSCALNARART